MTYEFLQYYWWFLVSLLGAILVFLLFVQGANSLLFSIGHTESERRLLINSTGRKWEFTFTTLVVFGGAFFASFPLFYSTSFGGAYWLWIVILFSFVVQAVSYEFQNKLGNYLGARAFQMCLVFNGIIGPLLLGGAVATFFNGSNFLVSKDNIIGGFYPTISIWANESHGLDALLDVWNIVLGVAVVFLAQCLGLLYYINNVGDDNIRSRSAKRLLGSAIAFVVLFVAFLVHVLFKDGYAVTPEGIVEMEPMKYFHNLLDMWYLFVLLIVGVVLVLYGIIRTIVSNTYIRGIWFTGIGVVVTVLVLFLIAGWNNTAYYPSNADLQSSLTLANSCSSEFTLRTMAIVSLLIPFVLTYIIYSWRKMDSKEITYEEIEKDKEAY